MSEAPDNVIFASYGNDSVALIQWAHERGLQNVTVAFNDTGWAAAKWNDRVERGEAWAQSLGFQTARIASMGMRGLVQMKSAWPRGGGKKYQFCTEHLKKEPSREWLHLVDPMKEAVCLVGIRREESEKRRDFPEHVEESPEHDYRALWAPLVRHTEAMRNELIAKTPLEVLPHRSKECYPCVNARVGEIKAMDEPTIQRIERMEAEAGTNSKGNERVMFSPKKWRGAVGIRAVVEAAKHGMEDLYEPDGCDGGWCGS